MSVLKRLYLLNGIAITAVVCNHITHWGLIAMSQWAERYRNLIGPYYDFLNSLTFYVLIVIRKLAVFSVPAFLFFSGFFVAYAARGSQPLHRWKITKLRVISLVVPYVIWSVVIFITDTFQGYVLSPSKYIIRLLYGGAIPEYYFVPLLIQFYLLSPLIIPIAKKKGKLVLLAAALLQVGMVSLTYLGLFMDGSLVHPILSIISHWSFFPLWGFFFTSGIVFSFHYQGLKNWLFRYKWILLAGTILLGFLAIIEAGLVSETTGQNWYDSPLTIPSSLYAISFIFSFLAFEEVSIPFSKIFYYLSNRTFGIYLIHSRVLLLFVWGINILLPWMVATQFLYLLVLFLVGLGMPLLMMALVAKSPAKRYYRYLFV
jgi:peptidoglycan/LPS O-acetylase OafA/YrhL